MSTAIKEPRAAPDLARHRTTELVAASSIEISPRDEFAGERLRELFDPGRTVFVNYPGSVTHHDVVAACARLRANGATTRRALNSTEARAR